MKESRENNEALMNLKECVRAKAKSAVQEEGFVHIPYRASKLTMLLKVRRACLVSSTRF
jgi:kinesin family protein 2/24